MDQRFLRLQHRDIVTLHGHIYSVKAPGTSYTALIPWVVFRIALLPMSAAHEPLYWAFVTYLTTVFTTGLLVSALCVVMFRFARFLGASEGRASGVALILGLATIAFPYATELTGEPVAAVCVFSAFYLLATFDTRPSPARAFAAGFLAGWAVLNDYPVLLVAAAIGVYALFKLRDSTSLAAFSAGAAITVAIMLAYNWGAFGNPFFFSYQAFKLSPAENRQFPEQAVGFVGLTYPKMRILWNVLLDPQRGCSSAIRFCCCRLSASAISRGSSDGAPNSSSRSIRSSCCSCSTPHTANRSYRGAAAPRPARGKSSPRFHSWSWRSLFFPPPATGCWVRPARCRPRSC
ncbi:MAG: hypothetical protein WCA22_13730 [Candidatus Binatus sp.]